MTAIICILGPMAIATPLSPVPISLCSIGILLTAYLLEAKYSTLSCLLYLLLGLVGLPVFAGLQGGAGILVGPNGGYLLGYLFLAFISGWFIQRFPSLPMHALGMTLGTLACYFLGTLWLSFQLNLSLSAAIGVGVLPFLLPDLGKILCVLLLGNLLKRRLKSASLL